MHKPFHIVLTTISEPRVLYEYLDNMARFNDPAMVKVWIVGDTSTPATTGTIAKELSDKGLETVYLDMKAQDAWGWDVCPDLYKRLPINNETRRNIGYLKALEDGCEVLISIDDDNYPPSTDFIKDHAVTGRPWQGPLISDPSGFVNPCEYLELSPARRVFPRGFPFKLRDMRNKPDTVMPGNIRIGVKTGLWTGAPDLDAVTWLNGTVESVAYRGEPTHVLSHETWIPLGTQNLSVCRDLVPACMCVPMGWEMPCGRLERYGDVWGGYFMQAIMRGTPYHAAFGLPLTEHRRNSHNPIEDLRKEYWGMLLTDWLVDRLKNRFSPSGSSVTDRTVELSEFIIKEASAELPGWCPSRMQSFIVWTGENLRLWADACTLFL